MSNKNRFRATLTFFDKYPLISEEGSLKKFIWDGLGHGAKWVSTQRDDKRKSKQNPSEEGYV